MAVLLVIDRPPFGDLRGREGLDMAFALAAFDQPVAILFTGAGVWWLQQNQDGQWLDHKTASKQLGAAGIFGIEDLFLDAAVPELPRIDPGLYQKVTVNAAFFDRFDHVVMA